MTSLDVTLDPVPNGARLIYVWQKRTEEEEEGATSKGKRTIYEIKALRHCDLHRLFGQKLHHN